MREIYILKQVVVNEEHLGRELNEQDEEDPEFYSYQRSIPRTITTIRYFSSKSDFDAKVEAISAYGAMDIRPQLERGSVQINLEQRGLNISLERFVRDLNQNAGGFNTIDQAAQYVDRRANQIEAAVRRRQALFNLNNGDSSIHAPGGSDPAPMNPFLKR